MDELKRIAVKLQRDTLGELVVKIKEKQNEGIIIDYYEVMEIISNLSASYER